jgi:hypothetical protein
MLHLKDCALENCPSGDDYSCCYCTCTEKCRICGSNFFVKTADDPCERVCNWCYKRELS